MKAESQLDQILDALKSGDALTPVDALNRFGCFRLAARISDLRRQGVPIQTVRHKDGFAIYRMT